MLASDSAREELIFEAVTKEDDMAAREKDLKSEGGSRKPPKEKKPKADKPPKASEKKAAKKSGPHFVGARPHWK